MKYTPQRFAAFENQVNIPLFNAAILLAAHTTDASKTRQDFYQDMYNHIWFDSRDQSINLEALGIRYLGELLERYEEKLGADIRNLRALALAMAYAAPVLTDSMFVTTQRENFLKKMHAAQSNDLYLLAASFLMADNNEQEEYRARLLDYPYAGTEEIIFTLSVLRDEDAFSALNTQLLSLMGKKRTLSVWNSIAMYGWVLHHRYDAIRENKRKNGMLMRALLSLASIRVKEDGSAWKALTEAGYTRQEILLMNAAFQWEPHLCEHRLPVLSGVTGEKVAVECVLASFGAESMPEEQVMFFCQWLIVKYNRFDVKLDGYTGILDVLKDRLAPTCPDIVIWMTQNLAYDLNYPFDIMDAKWDKLAHELPAELYHTLYRTQLYRLLDAEDAQLRTALQKYEKLTGSPYLNHFHTYDYQEQDAFALHVRLGLVDLFDFLQQHLEEPGNQFHCVSRHYVWYAVKDIQTLSAFRFWEQYFAVYTPQMVSAHFSKDVFFHEAFFTRGSYYYGRTANHHLSCLRNFLSREQQRQLTEWIDTSVFTCKPERYEDYALAFLKCDAVYDWYDPSELRSVFDDLCAAKPESDDLRALRKRFMSEAEQAEARQQEEHRKQLAAEKAQEQQRLELQETLEANFDGTLHSLYEFIDGMRWRNDKRALCLPMVLAKLQSTFISIPIAVKEQCDLLGLCQYFLRDKLLDWNDIATLLTRLPISNNNESNKEESQGC